MPDLTARDPEMAWLLTAEWQALHTSKTPESGALSPFAVERLRDVIHQRNAQELYLRGLVTDDCLIYRIFASEKTPGGPCDLYLKILSAA